MLYQEQELWERASRNVLDIARNLFTFDRFEKNFFIVMKNIDLLDTKTKYKDNYDVIEDYDVKYDQYNSIKYCIVQN